MQYELARDVAWRVLINNKVSSLPVDLFEICKAEGIRILTYSQANPLIKEMGLDAYSLDNDAFSYGNFIFYNETKPHHRMRFSIAHEIGHVLLHINSSRYLDEQTKRSRDEILENISETEAEANAFATRLLCPLCVLQYLNVDSISDIMKFCDVSFSVAKLRFSRLCAIRKRDKERRLKKGHGTFLLVGYEHLVIDNFKDFIEENKLPRKFTTTDNTDPDEE